MEVEVASFAAGGDTGKTNLANGAERVVCLGKAARVALFESMNLIVAIQIATRAQCRWTNVERMCSIAATYYKY